SAVRGGAGRPPARVVLRVRSPSSPPICRVMSARSGMVATTFILSAASAGRPVSRVAVNRRNSTCLIDRLLTVTEAVHVASEDDGPLQEELVVVITRRLEPRVLQPDALELRRPDGQVR